ncbi:MAG TPA: permease-like cell division protein FtsX, partial [Clostridiales bacterium]|nr:permease-like cell division protein FtsX [Clostridiales bacterium]
MAKKKQAAAAKEPKEAKPVKAAKAPKTTQPVKAVSGKQTATKRKSFNVSYLTKEGIQNVWSNRLMSFASVAVLVSCLLIIGLAVLMYANINEALKSVQDQSVIMVYLTDGVTSEEAAQTGQEIRMISDVEDAIFVSKEQAYQDQLKELGDDAALMEGLTENPLPDSYKVQLKTLENYDNVVENLKSISNVDSVRGNSDLASQVRELKNAVSIVCIGMILILLIVSLFIISNTV